MRCWPALRLSAHWWPMREVRWTSRFTFAVRLTARARPLRWRDCLCSVPVTRNLWWAVVAGRWWPHSPIRVARSCGEPPPTGFGSKCSDAVSLKRPMISDNSVARRGARNCSTTWRLGWVEATPSSSSFGISLCPMPIGLRPIPARPRPKFGRRCRSDASMPRKFGMRCWPPPAPSTARQEVSAFRPA